MSDKKKQLLNESTVRRFMGLAGIGALSNKFVDDKELNEATVEVPELDDTPEVSDLTEQPLDDELPPVPGEMAEPGPEAGLEGEEEFPGEEEVEDIDLSQEEAEVLIGLGRKLEAEMGDEEGELPPEGPEGLEGLPPGLPPEAMGPPPGAMQEALVRELTARVSRRVKKEYIVNEVMKRVATRLQGAPRGKKQKK